MPRVFRAILKKGGVKNRGSCERCSLQPRQGGTMMVTMNTINRVTPIESYIIGLGPPLLAQSS